MKHQIFRKTAYVALLAALLLPLGAAAQRRGAAANTKPSGPTPRTADGKVDFSGYWGRLALDDLTLATKSDSILGDNSDAIAGAEPGPAAFGWWITYFERDAQVGARNQQNRPLYKPEYWDKIRATDWDFSRKKDRANQCMPSVPRLGPPQRIVQLPKEIIFFYEGHNRFRMIPTDNRPHNALRSELPKWFGDSTGHWDGDTLVIETNSLIDQSWLGGTGYIHSQDTKVTERLQRNGDTMTIETTVEDPMLMQPWQMQTQTVKLNPNPNAVFQENICVDNDSQLLNDPKNIDPTRQGH